MSSTHYFVRISTSASELPQAVADFLEKQPCFDRRSATEFIIAGPSTERNNIRETLSSLLGAVNGGAVNGVASQPLTFGP